MTLISEEALTLPNETLASRPAYTETLHKWFTKGANGSYLLLTGSPGTGKTSLLTEFARQLAASESEGASLLPLKIVSLKADDRGVDGLVTDLSTALGLVEVPRDPNGNRGVEFAKCLLAGCATSPRLLMILDQLEVFHSDPDCLRFLPRTLPQGVRVVLALRNSIPALETLNEQITPCVHLELGPLTDEEIESFYESTLEPVEVVCLLAGRHLEQLVELSGRNALVFHRLLEAWSDLPLERKNGPPLESYELAALLESVDGFFAELIQCIEYSDVRRDAAESLELRLLVRLAIACEPLAPDQLGAILTANGLPTSIERIWAALHRVSTVLRTEHRKYFGTFCSPFDRFSVARYLGPENEREIHKEIVQWLEPGRPIDRVYRVEYLPYHLLQWGRLAYLSGKLDEARLAFGRCYALLTDFTFVREKLERPGLPALMQDYQAALRQAPEPVRPPTAPVEFWMRLVQSEEIWAKLTSDE